MDSAFVSIGATTLLAPIPAVLLSCRGTEPGFTGHNLITVAWTGVVNTDPPMISVSLRPERHSHAQIVQSGAFALNLVSRALCRAADFCGVKSGRDVDKFAALSLHAEERPGFPAPLLAEAPAALLCRVQQRIPLGSHDLFLCRVEDTLVHPALLDAQGALRLSRASLVCYAHGEYYPVSDRPEGFFGYSVAREDVLARRLGNAKRKPHAPRKGGRKG